MNYTLSILDELEARAMEHIRYLAIRARRIHEEVSKAHQWIDPQIYTPLGDGLVLYWETMTLKLTVTLSHTDNRVLLERRQEHIPIIQATANDEGVIKLIKMFFSMLYGVKI